MSGVLYGTSDSVSSSTHVSGVLPVDATNGCVMAMPDRVKRVSAEQHPGAYTHSRHTRRHAFTKSHEFPMRVQTLQVQTQQTSNATYTVQSVYDAVTMQISGDSYVMGYGLAMQCSAAQVSAALVGALTPANQPTIDSLAILHMIEYFQLNNCSYIQTVAPFSAGDLLGMQVISCQTEHKGIRQEWLDQAGYYSPGEASARMSNYLYTPQTFYVDFGGPLFHWKNGPCHISSLAALPLQFRVTQNQTIGWGTGTYATIAPIVGFTPKAVTQVRIFVKLLLPERTQIPAQLDPAMQFRGGLFALPLNQVGAMVPWNPVTAPGLNQASVQVSEDYNADVILHSFTWMTVAQNGAPYNGPILSANLGRDQHVFRMAVDGFPLYTTGGVAAPLTGVPVHLALYSSQKRMYSTVPTNRPDSAEAGRHEDPINDQMHNLQTLAYLETLSGAKMTEGMEQEMDIISAGLNQITYQLNNSGAVGAAVVGAAHQFQVVLPPAGVMTTFVLRSILGRMLLSDSGQATPALVQVPAC